MKTHSYSCSFNMDDHALNLKLAPCCFNLVNYCVN